MFASERDNWKLKAPSGSIGVPSPNVSGCCRLIKDANGQNAAKLTSTVFSSLKSFFGRVRSTLMSPDQ